MHIQVVNKGIDVSDALRERIHERLEEAVAKFSHRPGEAFVVIEREGHGFRVDCSVHLPSGALLQARASGDDAYGAAEVALDRLEKRLRRYKRKLVDHRPARANHAPATHTVLQGAPHFDEHDEDEAEDAGGEPGEPVIVAESLAQLPHLTVSMAVLELEVANSPVLVFRNSAHGGLNVVFRRPDGHVGWIDPERAPDGGSAQADAAAAAGSGQSLAS
ncbi:MAG: ribosome-associated translation inhibitor RaiA [Maricaulaceae bacterium]|jgi:ribosomal subunit interface protein